MYFLMEGIKKNSPFLLANMADVGRLPHDILQIVEGITAKTLIVRCGKIKTVMIKAGDLPVVAVNKNCVIAYEAFINENIIAGSVVARLMTVLEFFARLRL